MTSLQHSVHVLAVDGMFIREVVLSLTLASMEHSTIMLSSSTVLIGGNKTER
jgi:hypothetical protein